MSFFQKNKIAIVIGGSIFAVGVGVAIILANSSKKKKKQTEEKKEEEVSYQFQAIHETKQQAPILKPSCSDSILNPILENEEEFQQKKSLPEEEQSNYTKSQTSGKVKVQFLEGSEYFDLATITAILENSLDYIGEEFITFTQQNRLQRRQVRQNDIEQYKELVLEYNAQIEKMMLRAQDQLLEEVNIDKEQFENSYNSLVSLGYYQQLFMVQSAIRQKISEKLPKTSQDVTKDKMKEIIRYQLDVLINQKEQLSSVIQALQYVPDISELIPYVLNTMIQDFIFEAFKVEEEDQITLMTAQDILEDQEVHGLLSQIEEAMLLLMSSLGLTYIDEEQELAENESNKENGLTSEN